MNHIWSNITSVLLAVTSIFMVLIILLQRGRGGGLAGAFGASGGQSAFGTKAGDKFTIITIVTAVIWVALAGVTTFAMRAEEQATRYVPPPLEGGVDAGPTGTGGAKDGGEKVFDEGDQKSTSGTTKDTKSPDALKTAPPSDTKGKADAKSKADSADKSNKTGAPATKNQAGPAIPTPPAGSTKNSDNKTKTPPATAK